MQRKATGNWVVIGSIVLAIVFIALIMQQSRNAKIIVITDEPNNAVCLKNIDNSYSQYNCERTYGTWLNQGLCGFCRCPEKSIGWVKNFGCYYVTSVKRS